MFRKQAFYKMACLAMLALAVFLAGCANQETAEQVEEAAQTPVTRMINTSIGEIEIPAQPERIIVDWNIGHVLAVGVTPIGVPHSLLDYGEFMRKPLEKTADIGNHNQVSLEKMVELEPDLIITWNKDAYDSYSKIAPTVVFVPDEYASMEEEVTAMGEILNRQTEAEAWNEQFTRRAEAARKKAQAAVPAGATFTIADFNWLTNVGIVGKSANRGGKAVYDLLGLTPATKIKQDLIDKGEESMDISSELFGEYVGDYLLLMKSENSDKEDIPEIWAGMDAMKNNQVYELDIHKYLSADPYTTIYQAEEIAEKLASKQTKLQ